MKTKIKHLSKCALSAVLAVAMLMSTTLVGSVSAVGTAETTETSNTTEVQTQTVSQQSSEQLAASEQKEAEESLKAEQNEDEAEAVTAVAPEKKALQASGDGTYAPYYLIGRVDIDSGYGAWKESTSASLPFELVSENLYKCETGHTLKEWCTTVPKASLTDTNNMTARHFKVKFCNTSTGVLGNNYSTGSSGTDDITLFSYKTVWDKGTGGKNLYLSGKSDESGQVIFWFDTSDSNGNYKLSYTIDYNLSNYYYVYYYNDAVDSSATQPFYAYTYYNNGTKDVDGSLGGWQNTIMESVPGVANLYRVALKKTGINDTKIIFSSANGKQTANLDLPGSTATNIYYVSSGLTNSTINGSWKSTYETTPVVQTTHPVYFYNILGWTNLQGNYTTGGTTSTLTATAATDIGANWYKVEVPDTATSSDTLYFSGVRSEGVSGMTIRTEAYTCPTTSSNDKYFVPMYYTYYTGNTADGPQKVGCYVQSTTSDEITLESGKSYIYLRKNTYISNWTNIFAHLYKANDNTVKGTTWHGYRFRKVSGYTDLYAIEAFADTTNATFNFANCNRIAVSDGKDDAHAYENSTHQVTHRFLTYALSVNNVFTPLSTSSNNDTLDGSTTKYRREAEWQDFDRNLDTVATGKVRIYAKTGTIRTDATDTYDKYSRLADVKVDFKNGGTPYTANGANNSQARETLGVYYKRTPYLDASSNKHYRKVIADADANQEVTITVTLRDVNNVRDRYFVKAFIINGETYQVNTHNANGVYTMKFTPNDTYGSYIEVTPVYYYNESSTYNGTGNSYITLQVDDYESVKSIWGSTLAVYAWYVGAESTTTVASTQTGTVPNALGGYPGQPMVKIGNAYYMQIPKYVNGTSNAVKGVTMNSYAWDDVHSEITEFLIKNNISGARTLTGSHAYYSDGTTLRSKNERNCQTYDYDDFAVLADRNANRIRFTFKYRTWHSGTERGADGGNFQLGAKGSETYVTPDGNYVNLEQFVTVQGGNGWEALMDDYNVPVDLFANRLVWTQAYQTIDDNNAATHSLTSNSVYINQAFIENNKKDITDCVYVVSDGYENYYEYNTTTDALVNDYIGEYATRWYVYKRNSDGTFRYLGALPPSAFISNCIGADGKPVEADYLNYTATAQAYRTAGRNYTNSGKALYTTYSSLFSECEGKPVVICYESAIYSEGRTGSDGNSDQHAGGDKGYRCDGRWTYSKESQTVKASIEIQIVTKDANGEVNSRTLDSFASGEGATGYTGSITNADAYFTNSDFARTVSSPDVVENSDKNFTFTASSFKKGTDNKYYVFNGWQVVNGSITDDNRSTVSYSNVNSGSNVLSVDGASPMNGNMTFVATYVETDARTLVISHQLYALADTSAVTTPSTVPVVHNGTGTTQVKVEVLNHSNNNVINTYDFVSGSRTITDQTYLNATNTAQYDFRITLTTTPDSGSTMNAMYKLSPNTTLTTLSTGTTTTNTYTVTGAQVNALFGDSGIEASIPNYSDLTSDSVSIKFKYYDRKVNRGTVAENVDTTPTTITVTQERDATGADNAAKLKNTVGNAFTDNNIISLTNYVTAGKSSLSDISSVMDTYYFWPTQSDAVSGFGGMQNLRVGKTYSDNQNTLTYHADYYGFAYGESFTPTASGKAAHSYSGNGEKWVTYYDSSHKEVAYNDAVADPFRVASIEVWGLNRPKEIAVSFSYPNDFDEAAGTKDYSKTASFAGYYNERIGRANYGGDVDGLSDYLIYYGVTCVSTDSRRKNITAPASFSKDNGNGTTTYYYFDGWYNGDIKVSVDRTYANRITAPLNLTAKYIQSESSTAPGADNSVTVTSNGTETYISDKGVTRVRLLTQINVNGYLDPDTNESDEKINQMAMIYVKLPADADPDNWNDENKSAIYTSVKTAVEKSLNDAKVSNVTPTGVNVFTVTIETLNLNPEESATANTISYTYNVVWNGPVTAGEDITLTNKNRIQFSLDLTQSSVNAGGANSNIIAVAAVKDDNTNTWNLSTNGIIYKNGEAGGFIYSSGATEVEQQEEEPDVIVQVANLENVQIYSLEEEAA